MQENILEKEKKSEQEQEIKNEVKDENEKTFPLKYVEQLRRESSRYRTELKKMREQYGDFPYENIEEFKKLKESLELQKREDEIRKAKLKAEQIDGALTSIAESLSAVAPKQVAALLNKHVDINDDGKAFVIDDSATNVETFVKSFLDKNLHFVKSKGNKRGANADSLTTNIFGFEQVSKMTAEQYERNRDRILKSLSQKI